MLAADKTVLIRCWLVLVPDAILLSLSLQHQMDPSSNFYNYRTALRGATQRSITANSSREKVRHTDCMSEQIFTDQSL